MLRKILCAGFVAAVVVSLVTAEEFVARISKVEGKNVTFAKFKKGEKGKGEEATLPVADNVKVLTAKFNKDTMKVEAGEDLPQGLQNERFKDAKGAFAQIVTTDGKITEIRVFQPKKKD